VPKVSVPLSAQNSTPPMGGHRWTLTARAVHDYRSLYIELEWDDPRADVSVGRPQDFTDAAAIEFPAVASVTVPAFCMGDPTATVNIWQWRAAWQADVAHGFRGSVTHQYPNTSVDWYPFRDDPVYSTGHAVGNPFSVTDRSSAVDNLVAGGFGTLTADPTPIVQGWGVWRDGVWRVVFERPLAVSREGSISLSPDDWTNVAFAVWDGGAEERDGMKSVGNFVSLDISKEALSPASGFSARSATLVAVFALWVLFAWRVVSDLPGRSSR
jgi:hypothetical protein